MTLDGPNRHGLAVLVTEHTEALLATSPTVTDEILEISRSHDEAAAHTVGNEAARGHSAIERQLCRIIWLVTLGVAQQKRTGPADAPESTPPVEPPLVGPGKESVLPTPQRLPRSLPLIVRHCSK